MKLDKSKFFESLYKTHIDSDYGMSKFFVNKKFTFHIALDYQRNVQKISIQPKSFFSYCDYYDVFSSKINLFEFNEDDLNKIKEFYDSINQRTKEYKIINKFFG